MKVGVVTDDRGHRCLQGFLHVARRQRGQQARLGLGATQEDDARRATVGTGRPPAHQVVDGAQGVVVDGFVEPSVLAAGIAKQQVESVVGQWFFHCAGLL
ncbi:hypothetical protein D3C84_931860 [compost metagenome]